MLIYLITNKINGKYYVGQTVKTAEERWKQHVSSALHGGDSYFGLAVQKHRPENFVVETLCECPDRESLNKTEKFFIEFLASSREGFGYNSKGGGSKRILSKEEREKNKKAIFSDGRPISDSVFSSERYVVSWKDCLTPLFSRTFTHLEDATSFAKDLMPDDSLQVERVRTVIEISRLKKKEWLVPESENRSQTEQRHVL